MNVYTFFTWACAAGLGGSVLGIYVTAQAAWDGEPNARFAFWHFCFCAVAMAVPFWLGI